MQGHFLYVDEDASLRNPDGVNFVLCKVRALLNIQSAGLEVEALRNALYHGSRRKEETLKQYVMRRHGDYTRAHRYGICFDPKVLATLLTDNANLNPDEKRFVLQHSKGGLDPAVGSWRDYQESH